MAIAVQAAPVESQAQVEPANSGGVGAANNGSVEAANSGGAPRDPWRLTPSISIDETWSDNINLAPAGAERSDFVTTINPALRLTRFGPRLTTTLNYSPQFLYYANSSNGAQFRNSLDATANATLIENLLFFNALVSIAQGNISPFGTLAADSASGSTNRAETRTYSLGPTLRSRYGRDLTYSAGYQFTGSTSDGGTYAANHTSHLFAQFQNGTSFSNLGYGGDISRDDQSFGGSNERTGVANEIVQETAGVTLTYVLLPTLHLRGRLGYDRNSYPTSGQPDLKGPSYSGGFDWAPSQHTKLNAQVGHRYFGPTANISFRQSTSRFAVDALYSRDQTTSAASGLTLVADPTYAAFDQSLRTTFTDPALRAQAVTDALRVAGLSTSQFASTNFLSNQLFLQKIAQLSVTMLGLRNTVTFDARRSETRALSNIDVGIDVFAQTQSFRSTSFTANLSHKLGPRTYLNATASKIHNVAIQGVGDTKQRVLTASINRQIQRHLSGTLLFRNTSQTGSSQNNGLNGSSGNFFSGNYRENAVIGSLRLTF